MNTFVFSLLIFVFGIYANISCKIVEAPHFKDLLNFVTDNTLVILDVDDTLLLPCQTLGNDTWFCYRKKNYEEQGMTPNDALEKTIAEWEAIRHLTKVRIVESGTEKIIEGLQKRNIAVMGLTTQGLALATRTIEQLQSLHIDLTKTAPSKEDSYFINEHGVLFRKGLLFTSGTKKGAALLKLFDRIKFHPERIVFINDKATHLKDVEEAVQENGIEFIGLRYGFADSEKASFRPDVADLEWSMSTFERLMQDSEALALLSNISSS